MRTLVSDSCNLACPYCFYKPDNARSKLRTSRFMSESDACLILKKALTSTTHVLNIAFQGGEPTLIGLPYFMKLVDFVDKHKNPNLKVTYSLQTNGILIDSEWARFLSDHHFLLGLSLDGIERTNDQFRVDHQGVGQFNRILDCARLLTEYNVDFNILTVVTTEICRNIDTIYAFYKSQNFLYQQYTPWIPPFMKGGKHSNILLDPTDYGEFLKDLFDLWYEDLRSDNQVYVRYFDNLVDVLRNYPPQACEMLGRCTSQYLVESDGSVYCCDFYAVDTYFIGNLIVDDFLTIDKNRYDSRFIQSSMLLPNKCLQCDWKKLCRGGCRRYREPYAEGHQTENYYCDSFSSFFDYAYEKLRTLV